MTHKLKIWPIHWHRILEGTKTFELRENDRCFQKGDEVILMPWDKDKRVYIISAPYHELHRVIGDVYVVDSERVVFSLLKEEANG